MTSPRRAGGKKAASQSRFPENLRILRGAYSQTAFAERLLVSQQTLSFWERGKRKPNRRTWVVLEQCLGLSRAQLEGEMGEVPTLQGVAEGAGPGRTLVLPPPYGAAGVRIELKGLVAEAMGRTDIQRALREALRANRTVWLVVGGTTADRT